MKKILDVMRNFGNKSKEIAVSPEATATILVVCKVLGTISVPGVQTVCTGITELINTMEAARANDEHWKALLAVMQRYAKKLENFADSVSEGRPSNYLAESTDKAARDARDAILEFSEQIKSTKDKIDSRLKDGKIRKRLRATAIQGEIQECRQALAIALEDFNGRIFNILVMNTAKVQITVNPDPYDIPGAEPIRNGDFEIEREVDFKPSPLTETFWDSLVQVNLGNNKVRVAKIYRSSKNSKETFEKHMKFLSDMGPRMARICRYNADSRQPCMIFALDSVKPLMRYLIDLSRTDYDKFLFVGWKLFQDLHNAGNFLVDRTEDLESDYSFIESSIVDAAVGSNDQLVIAPPCTVKRERRFMDKENYAPYAIKRHWSERIVGSRRELYYRVLRPFTLTLTSADNVRKFLAYDLDKFTSPSQVSNALHKFWPEVGKRLLNVENDLFADGVTAGDVGVLEVGDDAEIQFRYLTNIADVFGGIKFTCTNPPTKSPNIYRETSYSAIDKPGEWYYRPLVDWKYTVDTSQIKLSVLARQFTMLGERYGVRPSSLAMVMTADYNLECGSCESMKRKLRKGRPIQCYVSFTPDNKFSGARWSFHDEPPSEEEAAAEASILKEYDCPRLWCSHRPWSGMLYWQLEDQDIAFHLKSSEDE